MSYPIKIGATATGTPLIGAVACRDHGAVVTESIYPSQMAYRVVATNHAGAPEICTATYARKHELEIVAEFPAADHNLSGRR